MEKTKIATKHDDNLGTGFLVEIPFSKYQVFRSKYLVFEIQCAKNLVL